MEIHDLVETVIFRPNHLDLPDSWIGHIPFANWLTRNIKPNIFVELGTQSGNSYFSFCQTVSSSRLSTKCYAVDTWKGDGYTGPYGEDVFEKVFNYHQKNYDTFSYLLRMTFDEALDYFTDESIELLHIDGYHTYEAVKHDFNSWLPKCKANAFILLHDINVKGNNFGVWKFWEELKQIYPINFEFIHSNGLGVVYLSSDLSNNDFYWFQSDCPDKELIRNLFSSLGKKVQDQFESQTILPLLIKSVEEKDQFINKSELQIENIQSINDNLKEMNEKNESCIARLSTELDESKIKIIELRSIVDQCEDQINKLDFEANDNSKVINDLIVEQKKLKTNNMDLIAEQEKLKTNNMDLIAEQEKLKTNNMDLIVEQEKLKTNNMDLIVEISSLKKLNSEYRQEIADYVNSTSWRVTRICRIISGLFKKRKK